MIEKEIKEGNKLIAEYMGYVYYHKGVDIDDSDIGGLYTRYEIFSKTPILVDEYEQGDQYYFSQVPNPDFDKETPERWCNDIRTLNWSSLNHYMTDPEYHSSWDWIMPVCKKILDSEYDGHVWAGITSIDLEKTFKSAVDFINKKNIISKNEI